ncbi:hypothetical protein [Mesorhizobium tamadayense]|uniref:hypothetical protein n=1 Tax=Mesorhizobium tamadayense TaxID=425306 RepID=UPI00142DCF9F|nr:hypothetical protein [Mesorhizobium tamadayense]
MTDNSTTPRQAQKIAVANNAALMLAFTVHFKDSDVKDGFSPKPIILPLRSPPLST